MHEAAPKLLENKFADQKGHNESQITAVVETTGVCRDIQLNDAVKNRHVKV